MPGQDRTGPIGQGPMTGRGFGPCGGGFRMGFGRGRGMGFGRGFGRGFGWRYYQETPVAEPVTLTKEQQKKILEAELTELEAETNAIKEKLKEL